MIITVIISSIIAYCYYHTVIVTNSTTMLDAFRITLRLSLNDTIAVDFIITITITSLSALLIPSPLSSPLLSPSPLPSPLLLQSPLSSPLLSPSPRGMRLEHPDFFIKTVQSFSKLLFFFVRRCFISLKSHFSKTTMEPLKSVQRTMEELQFLSTRCLMENAVEGTVEQWIMFMFLCLHLFLCLCMSSMCDKRDMFVSVCIYIRLYLRLIVAVSVVCVHVLVSNECICGDVCAYTCRCLALCKYHANENWEIPCIRLLLVRIILNCPAWRNSLLIFTFSCIRRNKKSSSKRGLVKGNNQQWLCYNDIGNSILIYWYKVESQNCF